MKIILALKRILCRLKVYYTAYCQLRLVDFVCWGYVASRIISHLICCIPTGKSVLNLWGYRTALMQILRICWAGQKSSYMATTVVHRGPPRDTSGISCKDSISWVFFTRWASLAIVRCKYGIDCLCIYCRRLWVVSVTARDFLWYRGMFWRQPSLAPKVPGDVNHKICLLGDFFGG